MHQNHTNFNVENNDPVAAGDRYWAHDLIRDFQYTRGLAGQLGKAIFKDDLLLSGDDTIGEVYGICETSIDVPDDDISWQIPKAYKTDKIYVVVHVVNKTVAVPDGNGTIRLRYTAENGSQRQRLFAEGEYTYFQSDDTEVIADSNATGTDELVIATYANAGTNLTITPTKTKWQRIDDAIGASIDASNAEEIRALAAEANLQTAINAKANPDPRLLRLKASDSTNSTSTLNTSLRPYISETGSVNGVIVNLALSVVPLPSFAEIWYVGISTSGMLAVTSIAPIWDGDKQGFYSSTNQY